GRVGPAHASRPAVKESDDLGRPRGPRGTWKSFKGPQASDVSRVFARLPSEALLIDPERSYEFVPRDLMPAQRPHSAQTSGVKTSVLCSSPWVANAGSGWSSDTRCP